MHDGPEFAPTRLLRRLRFAVESGFAISGLDSLYVRVRACSGAVVLAYHSVAAPETAAWIDPRVHVASRLFERQMGFLKSRRRIVSLTELVDTCERGETLPAGTVAITFDDGYLDNLTIAAPILDRLGIPATLFLATGYVAGRTCMWVDRLYSIFRTRTAHRLANPTDANQVFDLRHSAQRTAAYTQWIDRFIVALPDERDQLLEALVSQLSPSSQPPRLMMTWDDVRAMSKRYRTIDFGVHTREHVDLTSCDPSVAQREVQACAADFQHETGWRPAHFSFPYNRANDLLRQMVREAGFRSAVASASCGQVRALTNRFALPRVEPPLSLGRFRYVTSGAYPEMSIWLSGRA